MTALRWQRFIRYSLIGGVTFLFDLALLFIMIDYLGINYVVAAGLGFSIAVSLNYAISRNFVFKGAEISYRKGYVNFILIAAFGVLLVMAGVYLLVSMFAVHYLVARVAVSGVSGLFNYLTNLYFNFKVVGKEL